MDMASLEQLAARIITPTGGWVMFLICLSVLYRTLTRQIAEQHAENVALRNRVEQLTSKFIDDCGGKS